MVLKNYWKHLSTLLLTTFLLSVNAVRAQYSIPPKMDWWYQARFGMFIHFGSYSYLGHGEWAFYTEHWTKADYQTKVSAHFYPDKFNADTIAGLAKRAGMKYLVITAKHHEGFAMWHTKVQGFKDATGTTLYDLYDFCHFHRDILKELKDACDSQGIKFCLYYSILDWDHPSQTAANYYSVMSSMAARTAYISDMKAQLKELITRYHPAVMWFDGDWCKNVVPPTLTNWWNKNDGQDLYNYLIGLDSNLVINERVKRDQGLGDFECPEQKVPPAALDRPWETCETMNGAWGYDSSQESNYKSAASLIHEMVTVVSRDGNFLLNIGPKGDGTVTQGTKTILNGFGKWMKIYHESIYGTTRSPFTTDPSWGRYTKKDGKLYVHVFTWPTNGKLEVPALSNTINRIYLLNDTTKTLNYTLDSGKINISIPAVAPNTINSVLVIEVSGVPTAAGPSTTAMKNTVRDNKLVIFPNPVKSGILTIKQGNGSFSDIAIYNCIGKKVISRSMNSATLAIDLDGLSEGVYFVTAYNQRSSITQKLLIN